MTLWPAARHGSARAQWGPQTATRPRGTSPGQGLDQGLGARGFGNYASLAAP